MFNEWYTAKEIAGLQGLPATESGTIRKAKRENWQARQRQARGGGLEYHINALPAQTRSILRAKQIDTQPPADLPADDHLQAQTDAAKKRAADQQAKREASMAKFVALPAAKKERANARRWLITEAARYIEDNGMTKTTGLHAFCDALSDGLVIVPQRYKKYLNQLHGQVHLNASTLREWSRKYEQLGIGGLVDGYGARKGKSKIETNAELKQVILAALYKQPHITAKKIKQYLQAAHPQLDLVSVKSIDRYIASYKADNAQLWTYATNPDAWKNSFQPAFGSHHDHITRLNQIWELDSTPGDWMLTDGRHSVIGVIDLYSRRLQLYVSKTSKAAAVCQVFRKGLLAWGVPDAIRTDNGKDYVSEQFTTVVRDLHITQHLCIPFASEEKGTIERALQTMSHGILDLLPGFIGHNVAERKVIEARKSFASRIMQPGEVVEVALSAAELQEKLNQWADHIYMHDEHGGLGGKTPWQVATAWTGTINRITNERALDMLLAEIVGIRTITKKGITLDHHHYIAPELGPMIGSEVQLRRDESDIGRVFVYGLNGEFICIAQCPQILGFSPVEMANAAKAKTKRILAEQRDEMRKVKRSIKKDIAATIIEHRIQQSQNITAMPQRASGHTTPALEAAALAADARDGKLDNVETSASENATQAAIVRELTRPAPVVQLMDTPEKRYARAYWLERQQHMTAQEREWLQVYQRGNEYSAQKMICEDFGIEPERSEAGK